ncbi:uncharacterized protein EAE97_002451 [Botrytis byssoidea]|uniref:Uncharacterized protein n=1 Tax=Botrytis byssoidea TaxID=139641 RepID=A0A9P5M2F9_9HELO|nr:uncharacterized protein EAE97_002451 [Botrytis byssoidea]KAF7950899.1 hypothetical protein EAE97_002451 [Botrytis byssoidea]
MKLQSESIERVWIGNDWWNKKCRRRRALLLRKYIFQGGLQVFGVITFAVTGLKSARIRVDFLLERDTSLSSKRIINAPATMVAYAPDVGD